MYRIHQIKLKPGEPKEHIPEKILKKIGGRDLFIKEWHIARESIDARDKENISWVYSVDFVAASRKHPKKALRLPSGGKLKLEITPDLTYHPAVPGSRAMGGTAGCGLVAQDMASDCRAGCGLVAQDMESDCRAAEGGTDQREGAESLAGRPVVVGLGPAGLFCALILAQAGYRPLVIERGKDVDRRHEDVKRFWEEGKLLADSNVQFGEGGAGTFSDGKLTTGIKDVRIRKVLEEFVDAGAPEEILYKQKPHIGTDLLRIVVKNIRKKIIRLGGEVRFETRLEELIFERSTEGGAAISGLRVYDLAASREDLIPCRVAVLAVGHSARDTFRMLKEKEILMEQKPFSIGVRIEHPQDLIDIAQYGRPSRELGLPVAEYKINYRCQADAPGEGRGVYTFCMCPGGHVIAASSQEGGIVTNGMSYHDRDSGVANSALLCDVRTSDFGSEDVLAGVEFQEKYEKAAYEAAVRLTQGNASYAPPKATWGALRDGQASEVESCLPDFALSAFKEAMPHLGKKLKGFDSDEAVVSAVETRSSSPVRMRRDGDYMGCLRWNGENEVAEGSGAAGGGEIGAGAAGGGAVRLEGFYPCGEGAGYAGGITSAAVDGIKVAESVIERWLPPKE